MESRIESLKPAHDLKEAVVLLQTLDIKTILFSYVASNAICLVFILILWLKNRKHFQGIGHWLINYSFQFIGLFLIFARGTVPGFVSIVLANVILVGGNILFHQGIRKFLNASPGFRIDMIMFLAFMVLETYFGVVKPSLIARNTMSSSISAFICLECLLVIRTVSKKTSQKKEANPVFYILGITMFAHLARITIEFVISPGNEFFSSGLNSALALLSFQMLFIALTFGLLFMVNESLRIQLESDIKLRIEAEHEVRTLASTLESRVEERTEQLKTAMDSLESFLYSVSHDLKTPLRAIRSFAEILDTRFKENLPDKGRHYLGNIVEAATRMDRLIADLLEYSRLGRTQLTREPVDLGSLIRQVIADLSPRIEAEQAIIETAPDWPVLLTDGHHVLRIVANLLENALTFKKEGETARISIDWKHSGDFVAVSVTDKGIGIPSSQFKKIFEIFQRLHSRDLYPGTGIGLAAVRRSVELLGGSISVESTVGEGSTFTFLLPKQLQRRHD